MRTLRQFIVKNLKKHRELLPLKYQKKYFKCVTVESKIKPAKGRALVSYALAPAGLPDDHPILNYHGCYWMSNKIVSIFSELGYTVDCIQFTNRNFIPTKKYDVFFSFSCSNLLRLVAFAPESSKAIKIWHPGTSSLVYNNAAEMKRINDLKKRRDGVVYFPKRQESDEGVENRVIELADHIVVFDGKQVRGTFSEKAQNKITGVRVASSLGFVKKKSEAIPPEREFMWHFGNGAVHKGLDLLLEVFARNPQWKLNITGAVEEERDFMKIYNKELTEMPNVVLHGRIQPDSREFTKIMKKCFAFIAPSCSESISLACATMMQAGLYPLVSRDTGIDLPQHSGIYLGTCTSEEIEEKIKKAYGLANKELERQIKETQSFALKHYSRETFTEDMRRFLSGVLR